MIDPPGPKVSVCMITYNHEKYISQSINGVFMQKTSFDIEIVIGEDCSTDNTRGVICKFVESHPNSIKPIFRNANIGLKENFIDALKQCRGKYVAVISGDDYWIDPYKLQKQVDFLEENPEHVLVGHNAIIIDDDIHSLIPRLANPAKASFDCSTRDLMENNPFSSSEVLFRNHLINEFPLIYYQSTGEDRRLYILLSQFGKCRFEIDVTGVYRVHQGSITSNRQISYKSKLNMLEEYIQNVKNWNEYFDGKYDEVENKVIDNYSRKITELALRNRDLRTALSYSTQIKLRKDDSKKRRLAYRTLRIFSHVQHIL